MIIRRPNLLCRLLKEEYVFWLYNLEASTWTVFKKKGDKMRLIKHLLHKTLKLNAFAKT